MRKLLLTSLFCSIALIGLTFISCSNEGKVKEPTDYDYYQVVKVVFLDNTVDTLTVSHDLNLTILVRKEVTYLGVSGYTHKHATGIKSFSVIERRLKP